MTSPLIILTFSLLTLALFSGCASKQTQRMACFKGSSACFSQETTIPRIKQNCPNCHVTL